MATTAQQIRICLHWQKSTHDQRLELNNHLDSDTLPLLVFLSKTTSDLIIMTVVVVVVVVAVVVVVVKIILSMQILKSSN